MPQTRLETRIEYKLKRDTLRMITRVEVQKAKAQVEENKKPKYSRMLIFAIIFFAVVWIVNKLFNKYL